MDERVRELTTDKLSAYALTEVKNYISSYMLGMMIQASTPFADSGDILTEEAVDELNEIDIDSTYDVMPVLARIQNILNREIYALNNKD